MPSPYWKKHHTEESVGKAVAPFTWEHGIDKLRSSPTRQIAQWVWDGHFHMIKDNMLKRLVARTFQDFGPNLMKAKVNFPSAGAVSKCNTWATFYSGEVCVTSTIPVPCIEEPTKGDSSITLDGPKVDTLQKGTLHMGVSTIHKTLALFCKVSAHGMNLQANGCGQY